ncbi:MAG: hypothetical protein COU72_01480 [Parcubacteria group bacterium CG10_big_fil_rev_8_21_14_0_10_41_35]|nr:MAG: hypothetical protein COU72_01480 [Parcubacteria group bacterium CG10_big_fil_rev_8_21_14_0_10_41_35]
MNNTKQHGFIGAAAIIVIALIAVAAGAYYIAQNKTEDVMMQDDATHDGIAPFSGAGDEMMDDEMMPGEEDSMMGADDETMREDSSEMMQNDDAMMRGTEPISFSGMVLAGSPSPLIDFKQADYEKAVASNRLVVLYFYANWCPVCAEETAQALYPAFNELNRSDVVGFRVNFNDNDTDENEKALAKEFGVAYQHTKVFVKDGERVLKSPESWDKSRYADEIEKAL